MFEVNENMNSRSNSKEIESNNLPLPNKEPMSTEDINEITEVSTKQFNSTPRASLILSANFRKAESNWNKPMDVAKAAINRKYS